MVQVEFVHASDEKLLLTSDSLQSAFLKVFINKVLIIV